MTAQPASRFLANFEMAGDARALAAPRSPKIPERSAADIAAEMAKEAFARGFADATAKTEARLLQQIESLKSAHGLELTSERARWAEAEARRLSEELASGLKRAEQQIADQVSRILRPFVESRLRRRAVEDLREQLERMTRDEHILRVKGSGPADLIAHLRDLLTGSQIAAELTTRDDQIELQLLIGDALIETNIADWLNRLSESAPSPGGAA